MEHARMINLSMAVLENEGEIVFLKKLKEGPAAGSYGLHVAKLAGIPEAVLLKARTLRDRFSSFEQSLAPSARIVPALAPAPPAPAKTDNAGEELFSREDMAIARIRALDPDRMTPLEALKLLAELRNTL